MPFPSTPCTNKENFSSGAFYTLRKAQHRKKHFQVRSQSTKTYPRREFVKSFENPSGKAIGSAVKTFCVSTSSRKIEKFHSNEITYKKKEKKVFVITGTGRDASQSSKIFLLWFIRVIKSAVRVKRFFVGSERGKLEKRLACIQWGETRRRARDMGQWPSYIKSMTYKRDEKKSWKEELWRFEECAHAFVDRDKELLGKKKAFSTSFSHDSVWASNRGIRNQTLDYVFLRFTSAWQLSALCANKCDLNFLIMFEYLSRASDSSDLLKSNGK